MNSLRTFVRRGARNEPHYRRFVKIRQCNSNAINSAVVSRVLPYRASIRNFDRISGWSVAKNDANDFLPACQDVSIVALDIACYQKVQSRVLRYVRFARKQAARKIRSVVVSRYKHVSAVIFTVVNFYSTPTSARYERRLLKYLKTLSYVRVNYYFRIILSLLFLGIFRVFCENFFTIKIYRYSKTKKSIPSGLVKI